MLRSNLFAHIELTKFVEGLSLDAQECRQFLLLQHAYFKQIPSKMFSDQLATEWQDICMLVSGAGPERDEDGRVVGNDVKNTIGQMSNDKCLEITQRLTTLQQKVAAEF